MAWPRNTFHGLSPVVFQALARPSSRNGETIYSDNNRNIWLSNPPNGQNRERLPSAAMMMITMKKRVMLVMSMMNACDDENTENGDDQLYVSISQTS